MHLNWFGGQYIVLQYCKLIPYIVLFNIPSSAPEKAPHENLWCFCILKNQIGEDIKRRSDLFHTAKMCVERNNLYEGGVQNARTRRRPQRRWGTWRTGTRSQRRIWRTGERSGRFWRVRQRSRQLWRQTAGAPTYAATASLQKMERLLPPRLFWLLHDSFAACIVGDADRSLVCDLN